MSLVHFKILSSGIAIVTLNNPQRLNVLSRQLIADLNQSLDILENDETIKCLIITGVDSVFSSGADLKELEPTPHRWY